MYIKEDNENMELLFQFFIVIWQLMNTFFYFEVLIIT